MAVPSSDNIKNPAHIFGYSEDGVTWKAVPINSDGSLSIGTTGAGRIVQYDNAGSGIIYVGWADPGTATSAASWKILKLDESSLPDFNTTYADGNTNFDNIWDNRAALSYS